MGRQQIEELSRQEILSATTQREYHQLAQEMLRVTDPTRLREGLDFYPRIQIKAMIEALPALQGHFERNLGAKALEKKMANPAKTGVAFHITGRDFNQGRNYLTKIEGFEGSRGHCHGLTAMWLMQPKFFPKLRHAIGEGWGNPMIMAMTYLQHHQQDYDPTRNNAFRQAFVDKGYPIKTYRGRGATKATAVADLLVQAKANTQIDRAYVHLDLGNNGAHVVGFRFRRGVDNQIKEVIYLDTNDKEKRWQIRDGLSDTDIAKIATEIKMDEFQSMTAVLGDRQTFENAYCQLMPDVLAQETHRLAEIDSSLQARAVYELSGQDTSSRKRVSPKLVKSNKARVETVKELFHNSIAIIPSQTSFVASKTQHEVSVTCPNERQLVITVPVKSKSVTEIGKSSPYQKIIPQLSELIKELTSNPGIADGEQIKIEVDKNDHYLVTIELDSEHTIQFGSSVASAGSDCNTIRQLITKHDKLIRVQNANDELTDQALAFSNELRQLNNQYPELGQPCIDLQWANQALITANNELSRFIAKVEGGDITGVDTAIKRVEQASQALSEAMAKAEAARDNALAPQELDDSVSEEALSDSDTSPMLPKQHKHNYKYSNRTRFRNDHSIRVEIEGNEGLPDETMPRVQGLVGDALKTELLDILCEKIDKYLDENRSCSKSDLKSYVEDQPEVRVIDRAQDAFTRNTRILGIKTSSRVALNAYVNKAFAADRPAPQQQAKTNFQS